MAKELYTYLDARFELGRLTRGSVLHTPDYLVARRGHVEIRVSDQDGPLSGGPSWDGMTWRVEAWVNDAKLAVTHSTNSSLPSLRGAVLDSLRQAAATLQH